MKQSKNLFKVLGVGLTALAILVTISFLLIRQPQEKTKEKVEIAILSHNTASINNNPIEYTSRLEKLSESEDPILRQSARKLLQVNNNIALGQKSQKIKEILYKKNIKRVVQTVCEVIGWGKTPEEIIQNFLQENGELTLHMHFSTKLKRAGYLDKELRTEGTNLPSPIFYNEDFLASIQAFVIKAKEGIDSTLAGYFTQPWIEALKQRLPDLYKKMKLTPEEFVEAVLTYYLFFHYILLNIHQEDAMLGLIHIARHHQKINVSKDEKLAQSYAAKQATFISLQEADSSTIKQLYQHHDYIITEKDKIDLDHAESFGSINLYKKSFIEKNHYTITKRYPDKDKVEKYRRGVSDKNFNKLFTEEVNINQLENNKHIILHISFHADSAGDNTKAFLQSAFDIVHTIKQSYSKPVYLIICMDGNTTIKGTKNKRNLDSIASIVKEADCKIIQHQGEDTNTTKKERSHMQVQFNKAGKVAEEQSDIIIVSNNITIKEAFLDPYTELSDHRTIGAYLTL